MKRKLPSFASGPAALPKPVTQAVSDAILGHHPEVPGSLLELGHRTAAFERIIEGASALMMKLMGVNSDEYEVLWLPGGASFGFATIPLQWAHLPGPARIAVTGEWGQKAWAESSRVRPTERFASLPDPWSLEDLRKGLPELSPITAPTAYIHLTMNNTVEGTSYPSSTDFRATLGDHHILIADTSSEHLGVYRNYSQFDMIYGGVQKNLGFPQLMYVVLRKSLLAVSELPDRCPKFFHWKNHAAAHSLLNTPPVPAVFGTYEMLKWIQTMGGFASMCERNQQKATSVYNAISQRSELFEPLIDHTPHRSITNITFRTRNSCDAQFIKFAKARGIEGITGYRTIGGIRVSLYNAIEIEDANAVAQAIFEWPGD